MRGPTLPPSQQKMTSTETMKIIETGERRREAQELVALKRQAAKEGMQFKDMKGKTALELRRFICVKQGIPPPLSPRPPEPADVLWGDGKEQTDPLENMGYAGGQNVVEILAPVEPKAKQPMEVLSAVEAASRG